VGSVISRGEICKRKKKRLELSNGGALKLIVRMESGLIMGSIVWRLMGFNLVRSGMKRKSIVMSIIGEV